MAANRQNVFGSQSTDNSRSLAKRLRVPSDEATQHYCQKCDREITDKMTCNGCKLSYCLKCANITPGLYQCLQNGEMNDFMWNCKPCKSTFPSLDNLMGVMKDFQGKQEDRMKNIENRMTDMEKSNKIELNKCAAVIKDDVKKDIKSDIDKLVDKRINELKERERRQLNIVIFNLPESTDVDGAENKKQDELSMLQISSALGLDNLEIVTSFRMGKKSPDIKRPFKVILKEKSQKKFLLDNAKHSKDKLSDELKGIVIAKDLTPQQRTERREWIKTNKNKHVKILSPPQMGSGQPTSMETDQEFSPIFSNPINAIPHFNNFSESRPNISESYTNDTVIGDIGDETIIGGLTVGLEEPTSPTMAHI